MELGRPLVRRGVQEIRALRGCHDLSGFGASSIVFRAFGSLDSGWPWLALMHLLHIAEASGWAETRSAPPVGPRITFSITITLLHCERSAVGYFFGESRRNVMFVMV